MKNATEIEIKISGGRIVDAKIMTDGVCKLTVEIDDTHSSDSLTKTQVLENKSNSIILPSTSTKSEFEKRIDPETFNWPWLETYIPKTENQKLIFNLYHDAKANGRLHPFTCMTISPSRKDGKLVYEKGLKPDVGHRNSYWEKMFKKYDPNRNSRQMTLTEYACKMLYLINAIVKRNCECNYDLDYVLNKAWSCICDNSEICGHYFDLGEDNWGKLAKTGTYEFYGFCDLANTFKAIANDPWDTSPEKFWMTGGCYVVSPEYHPLSYVYRHTDDDWHFDQLFVGEIALD